jgi:hypothetical protein
VVTLNGFCYSVLADTLLLYRCYVVWDYDKRVVVGPALLLIAATVCGYLFEGSTFYDAVHELLGLPVDNAGPQRYFDRFDW